MVRILPAPGDQKPHDHLEIHALVDGGYVVREGKFNMGMSERIDETRWSWKQERAAFATLRDAVAWVEAQMVDKSPTIKGKTR